MTQDEIIRMALEAGLIQDFGESGTFLYNKNKIERFAALVAANEREKQAEQEPVGEVIDAAESYDGYEAVIDTGDKPLPPGTKLYAAPVRAKDLTDDEIAKAVGSPLDEVYLADFRAVIAADREKNK